MQGNSRFATGIARPQRGVHRSDDGVVIGQMLPRADRGRPAALMSVRFSFAWVGRSGRPVWQQGSLRVNHDRVTAGIADAKVVVA